MLYPNATQNPQTTQNKPTKNTHTEGPKIGLVTSATSPHLCLLFNIGKGTGPRRAWSVKYCVCIAIHPTPRPSDPLSAWMKYRGVFINPHWVNCTFLKIILQNPHWKSAVIQIIFFKTRNQNPQWYTWHHRASWNDQSTEPVSPSSSPSSSISSAASALSSTLTANRSRSLAQQHK